MYFFGNAYSQIHHPDHLRRNLNILIDNSFSPPNWYKFSPMVAWTGAKTLFRRLKVALL
jgi:hypothetical protein